MAIPTGPAPAVGVPEPMLAPRTFEESHRDVILADRAHFDRDDDDDDRDEDSQ